MTETEVKILNVDPVSIREKMNQLGAEAVSDNLLLKVDWYRTVGVKDGEDKWYLRIRSYSDGKKEVTWKGKSDVLGVSRQHKEINFLIDEPEKLSDLFLEIGLEKYAHQEKYRSSWTYKDWQFDLDTYPLMPSYLEIEGRDENHIKEAINLLDLGTNETSSEGERKLIQEKYGLDWYNMKF